MPTPNPGPIRALRAHESRSKLMPKRFFSWFLTRLLLSGHRLQNYESRLVPTEEEFAPEICAPPCSNEAITNDTGYSLVFNDPPRPTRLRRADHGRAPVRLRPIAVDVSRKV